MTQKETNQVKKLKKQLNDAYKERNALVQTLTFLYPAHLAKDKNEPNWPVVCIHIPVTKHIDHYQFTEQTQAAWHIPKRELKHFRHLNFEKNDWDGHTTEQKYHRLMRIKLPEQKKWYQFWK